MKQAAYSVLVILLVGIGCSRELPPSQGQSIEIGTQTQLVVDDFAIEVREAVERWVNALIKHPANPILRPDRPWEGQSTMPSTVLYDGSERLFKMWYGTTEQRWNPHQKRSRWAYATSQDGIAWEKPELGLVDFRGSRRNNLLPDAAGRVLMDFAEKDSSRRFKALRYGRATSDGPEGICVAFSPDGLRWEPYPGNPLLTAGGFTLHWGIGDTLTLFGWDEKAGKYVSYMRPSILFRHIGRSESTDFIDWKIPNPVLVPDEEDPPGTQFYGMSVFRDREVYFGFLWVYHPNSLIIDVQLAYSRDGIGWRRTDRRHPILSYGLPYRFDSHVLIALEPLIREDEIWVYCAAENKAHVLTKQDLRLGTHSLGDTAIPLDQQSWLKERRGYGGLAMVRRDGLVSLDSDAPEGVVTTKPFVCRGKQLLLNADASRGRIRVELLDRMGVALPGFEAGRSDPLHGDSVSPLASWDGKSDLSSLEGRKIKLRLLMSHSKLFSFRFGKIEGAL